MATVGSTTQQETATGGSTPQQGIAPLTINFNNTSIGDGLSYFWDFGDGGSSTDRNPTYTFENAGIFSISLTVTNENGNDTKSSSIVVLSGDVPGPGGGNQSGNQGSEPGGNQGGNQFQ